MRAVPGVRVVPERLAHEAAIADAALRIRNEQLGMRELVHPEPAARAARALGIVEHEVGGPDVAVHEAVRRTRVRLVEPLARRLSMTPFARWICARPSPTSSVAAIAALIAFSCARFTTIRSTIASMCFTRRFVELDLLGDVDRCAVDDHAAAALLPYLGEHDVEVFAVDLEHRRTELDFCTVRQRENRLQDLARRVRLGHALARARAVRLADRWRTGGSGSSRCPSWCRRSSAGCCRSSSARWR